jgi:hypothetical protein
MAKHHRTIYRDHWNDYTVGDVQSILGICGLEIEELLKLNREDFSKENTEALWLTIRRLNQRLADLEDTLGNAENLNQFFTEGADV